MDNFPLVSVIIPVFNGEKFLESALKSVFSQTFSSDLQIIVVDDGSTDKTSTIVKKYPEVHYLYQKNSGVSAARNTALELAKGKFIAFLDADDMWKPEKLHEQITFMEQHPEISITGTSAENFLEFGAELPAWMEKRANWEKLNDYIIPSTMVVRQSVFNDVGLFDTDLPSGEDTDWLWRAKEAGVEWCIIDKVLVKRRFHGGNLSWKHAGESRKRLLWIARKSIQRKSGK